MRVPMAIPVALALALAGCSDTAELVPANAAAAGTARLTFLRGMGAGPMTIKLSTGEVLSGTFTVSEAPQAPGGPGNFHVSGTGPYTRITCDGTMTAGHGTADCRTQDGALYRVTL